MALDVILNGLKTIGGAVLKGAKWFGKNTKQIGTFLGGASSLGSMLGLGSSGGTDYQTSANLMALQDYYQRAYTKWLNENQYSQLRTGLEKAGYNPLLALGAEPSAGSTGIANATTGTRSDPMAFLTYLSTMAQIDNLNSQTAKNNRSAGESIMKTIGDVVDELRGNGKIQLMDKLKDLGNTLADNFSKTISHTASPASKPFELKAVKYNNGNSSTAQSFGSRQPRNLEILNDNNLFRKTFKQYKRVFYNSPPSTIPY